MAAKKALITGITGQDGSYLAELLVAKGYSVHGLVRRVSQEDGSRMRNLESLLADNRITLHSADLSDRGAIRRIFEEVAPDEFYHLAGQSHVGLSFEIPESTFMEVAGATLSLLEICRDLDSPPRFYHAGSSEIFGDPDDLPQTERTAFRPTSPYGCAKACSVNLCKVYRDAYGLFIASGIAYNHESIRRSGNFVTKKIAGSVARIASGESTVLELGNLNTSRDWGYAPDFVEGMWRVLQQPNADEFIFATGELTNLRDFVRAAFDAAGIKIEFRGEGAGETGVDASDGRTLLRVNPQFFRPMDPCNLVGNPTKAGRELGWHPSIKGTELAKRLVLDEIAARRLVR